MIHKLAKINSLSVMVSATFLIAIFVLSEFEAIPAMAVDFGFSKTPDVTSGFAPLDVTYTYRYARPATDNPATTLTIGPVHDNKCSPVTFVGGDVNSNNKIDPGETWTWQCTTTLTETTTNTAQTSTEATTCSNDICTVVFSDFITVHATVVVQTNACGDVPATIVGTTGNDNLVGTSGRDVIQGNGGDDTITGLAGNDLMCGGDGKDTISGGTGNDEVGGNAGNDVVDGGSGNDRLNGDNGDDQINGGSGNDELRGATGNDRLIGDSGTDTADGDIGTDSCDAETETDCES